MMLKRGLALCVVLAFASVTRAQTVNVTLTPSAAGPYTPGQNVSVDVLLSQSGTESNIAKSLRFVQLDVSASTSSLLTGATLPATHTGPNPDVLGWDFAVTPECTGTPNNCGSAYFLEAVAGLNAPAPRDRIMSAAYKELAVDANRQWIIPANLGGPAPTVKVARINLVLPMIAGTYDLNVMNAAGTGDRGAEVRWGFGLAQNDPLAVKRAQDGGITGGTASFVVPPIGPVCKNLQSGVPAYVLPTFAFNGATHDTLWRTQNNTIRLTFDGTITAPTAGQILIQQMTAGGNYGADKSANFTFTVEGGNVLRIREVGAQMPDNTWFAIRNTGGWTSACNFTIQYPVNIGDFDGNGPTTSADVLSINAAANGARPNDQARDDVDGNGFKVQADVLTANANQPSPTPAKPAGH